MRLHVSNVPFSATDEDLAELFAKFGEVASATIITDRETGQSRRFAFVELQDEAAAQRALKFDGFNVRGRQFRFNTARPRT